MNNAFSVLSLKRNRSTSTTHTKANSCSEPVSKLSKLKSGFSIFSKITNVISLQHDQDTNYEQKKSKRASWIDLLQYFRAGNGGARRRQSRLRRNATYDSDSYYEYHNYYKKNAQQIERNTHTSPTTHTKKLNSILIKQSGSNPQQQPLQHQLTKVSSRVSNTHTSVSNITVNSEDLTAKEFADIAGIRILSETEDDPIDEERKVSGNSSSNMIGFTEDTHLRTVSTGKSFLDDEQYSVVSCISAQDSKPKIWDIDFWKNPDDIYHHVNQSQSTTPKPVNNKQQQSVKSTHVVTVEPPILHELRRMSTRNNDNKLDSSVQQHYVIKKGRFEIQLGDIDSSLSNMTTSTNDSANQQTDGVLEWKRKRKE